MARRVSVTPNELRQLLRYEPETGKLFWLPREASHFDAARFTADHQRNLWNSRHAGKQAFTALSRGYPHGAIFNRLYRAHRIVWAIVHGEWPADQVDHINGIRHDNRLANLRAVNRSENMRNAAIPSTNKSGVMGVSWTTRDRRWTVRIWIAGKHVSLGNFTNFDEACAVRRAAEVEQGYHVNHGRVSK